MKTVNKFLENNNYVVMHKSYVTAVGSSIRTSYIRKSKLFYISKSNLLLHNFNLWPFLSSDANCSLLCGHPNRPQYESTVLPVRLSVCLSGVDIQGE